MTIARQPFNQSSITQAFDRLGEMAVAADKVVEISVYGGSALILTLHARPATRDVDAVFDKDRTFVRRAAEAIAEEFGWQSDWLNDSVKGFLSRADSEPGAKTAFRDFPASGPSGLRVLVASPGYCSR